MGDLFGGAKPKRRNDDPERRDQSWSHKLLERIVLQPRWLEAVDHASVKTDNQRSRFQAAGGVFGTQDYQLYQLQVRSERADWAPAVLGGAGTDALPGIMSAQSEGWCRLVLFRIEFKHGANTQQPNQIAAAEGCAKVGIPTDVCYGPWDAYQACVRRGFLLHGNAENLAREYQDRAEASHVGAKHKKPRVGGVRKVRPSQAALAAGHRYHALVVKKP
jgi:hypothetical protein